MKKYFFVSITIYFFSAFNQSFCQIQVDAGIKGGLSIPNLSAGSDANPINSGYRSRLGADAAIQAEIHFSKHFSIQPQLEYSEQGGKKNGNQAFAVPAAMAAQFPPEGVPPYLYANYNSVAKINYLMLPILATWRFGIGHNWSCYIAAGPFISYLLSAKNITTGSSNIYLDAGQTQQVTSAPQSFNNSENIKSDLHALNGGISGHLGLSYLLPKGSLFLEAGGNYGLIDIQKDATNGNNKTGAASVNMGYQFRLCMFKSHKKMM